MAKELDANALLSGELDELPADAAEDDYEGEELVVAPTDRSHIYGRLVKVPPGTSLASPAGGVQSIRETRERVWSITIQQVSPQPIGDSTDVNAVVAYYQGQAKFTKPTIDVGSTNAIRFSIVARYVEVVLFKAGGGTALVNVAVVPGEYTGADQYAWQWAQSVSGTDFGLMTTLPGVLGQVHVIFRTPQAPGTALWPLLFDQANNAQPPATQIPIRGGRLDALFNAGDGRSQADEEAPGTVAWSKGLVVALSTRPDQYAAPVAGNNVTIDLKFGQ